MKIGKSDSDNLRLSDIASGPVCPIGQPKTGKKEAIASGGAVSSAFVSAFL